MAADYDSVFAMEPMMPEQGRAELEDLAVTLVEKASALAGQVNPLVSRSIGDLVRSMNCYYSNLIEGHDTHPRDIERAMQNDYSADPKKRDLQLEARAHIELQRIIDFDDATWQVASADFVRWLHREFCSRLPEDLLWVENPDTGEKVKVVPGEFRDGDVQVGLHVPPAAESIERFLARFEEVYAPDKLSRLRQVVAVAASHHRLLWIHPFYDGNGRVARMHSHAYLKKIGVGSSLWSVSRGLARRVGDYKRLLMAADNPRQGDLDGRGNLSSKSLHEFCIFFLETCIDQVEFMEEMLKPTELIRRIERYTGDAIHKKDLPKGSYQLLREALHAGEFERGRAAEITGYKERQGRSVLNALLDKGLLVSDTQRGPVRLGFPNEVVDWWFPRLYPVT
ncbi:MAG: Fic family protein [Alphaproteobacteria bacterium]|nr:Fic family protein [Alphaproteobacteria bacterium]